MKLLPYIAAVAIFMAFVVESSPATTILGSIGVAIAIVYSLEYYHQRYSSTRASRQRRLEQMVIWMDDDSALYAIMQLLRGPDSNYGDIKFHTTARLRHSLGLRYSEKNPTPSSLSSIALKYDGYQMTPLSPVDALLALLDQRRDYHFSEHLSTAHRAFKDITDKDFITDNFVLHRHPE